MAGWGTPRTTIVVTAAIAPPITMRLITTVDTRSATVPRAHRRLMWATGSMLVFLTLVYVGLLVPPLPYATYSPGSAPVTENLISVQGAPVYPADADDGRVLFTTVSIHYSAEPWRLIEAWHDPAIDILHMDKVTGGRSASEQEAINQKAMQASKDTALLVGVVRAGYPLVAHGVLVLAVAEGTDAAAQLHRGDVISGADGQPVQFLTDLQAIIATHAPGEVIRLRIDPAADDFEARDLEITLVAKPDDPTKAAIGITEGQDFNLGPPFPIVIDSGRVGGPSAGLAFTLGVIDVLTPGDLAGGHVVAVTGTIEPDGHVGRVGGVAQKALAAKAAGADVLLVPVDEYESAVEHAPDGLRVMKVDTLDDALAALASIGGDAVPATNEAATG